ncbi:MAG: DUF427 domain-containing protein [Nannocystaceae bacterium]|nr:DUF427 domain-containing protein [Nannocystaceae bacterium]
MTQTPPHQAAEAATLVRGAISRPDEPRHFMVIEPVEGAVVARAGAVVLARSTRAVRVREVGHHIYEPVVYFPPQDVDSAVLRPTEVITHCPLKGRAAAFDVHADEVIEGAAWSYQQMFDFDPRLGQLESCVAFDASKITVEPAQDA